MLTLEESIHRLKRDINAIRGMPGGLRGLVTLEAGYFIALADDLVTMAEKHLFSEHELHMIWCALKANGDPASVALAERVQEMAKHYHGG